LGALGSPVCGRLWGGTAVAVCAGMHRSMWLVACFTVVAARGGVAAELPPPPPGVDAFVGCQKYPAAKKFKWSVRGEVGVAELATSLGEISCKPIVVAKAVAERGGKV